MASEFERTCALMSHMERIAAEEARTQTCANVALRIAIGTVSVIACLPIICLVFGGQ